MLDNAERSGWKHALGLCLLTILLTKIPITGLSADATDVTTLASYSQAATTGTRLTTDTITEPITAATDPTTASQAAETTPSETATLQEEVSTHVTTRVTTLPLGSSTPSPPQCSEGWVEHNERCYRLVPKPQLSWQEAREVCHQRPSGDLLVLNSTEEQRFINDIVSFGKFNGTASNLWIGLTRNCSGVNYNFSWIDGVALTDELKHWENGQPDNFFGDECCVGLLAGNEKIPGIFRDRKCIELQGYICEEPIDPPQEEPTPSPSPSPSLQRPPETSSMMEFQMISSTVLFMTSAVQLYSSIATSSSIPQPTPTPTWAPLPSSPPTPLPGTTAIPVMCRAEILDGLQWKETEQNTAAVQACPENPFATVRRTCVPVDTTSAAWRGPDYSDCQIPTRGELLNRLTLLSHFSSVDPGDVIKATFQLSQMLAPSAALNSADEYSVMVELLEMVAALPDKFTECRQADMENFANSFLQAVANILHPSNIVTWNGNKEVASDTVRIIDAIESFTAQTATDNCELRLTSHEETATSFEGKYDNIVFRKSRESPAAFTGLIYSASSPRASITLPPEVFKGVTDEQVTLLIVLYSTIGDLLDSVPMTTEPSPGNTMKVNSAVVTSSGVHQSGQAFEKLSVPLCINFTKKNPTFEKEEKCVFLSRTESGESQWLTDGCWMNEQRNGSVHCCCNHMTSFALLSATETLEPYHLLLLTYVLCSASCFIILLSALILFSVRHLNAVSLTVHVSLALSIILSFVVVMAGLERTANQVLCRILAVATHYILTSQFVWSLEGALQVWHMANSERQEQRAFQLWIYHVIGWCGPVLPVGICMALWLGEYGGAERCWFSNNVMVGLISSLAIPALINILLLVYISGKNVPTGTTMASGTDDNHAPRQRTMDGVRSNLLILVFLCVCWGFGIAAFQLQDDFLQQAFAVSALLLGVCFFMVYLVMSHDVRQAILQGHKKNRRKNRMKLRQRKSDDSSTNPEVVESRQPVHVQPPSRNDHFLGSTSTSLSQQNTHSIGTNCTDVAGEPIQEEGYGPYQRGNGTPNDLAMDSQNVGFDQRILPWNNLGLIRARPESLGNRSPQMVRRGDRSPDAVRRSRREASPLRRNGNIVLNHRQIIKDAEEVRPMEEESRRKKRQKRHVSSISGSSHNVDMACMPFPMDLRDIRGSRVHPMPLDQIPYSMDYSQGLVQPQYIHPRMAGFLAHPQRALPAPIPSTSLGRGPIPDAQEFRQDPGGFRRSLGYYGNERNLRDGFYDGPHQARDGLGMSFRGQSSHGYQRRGPQEGNHGNWATDADESRPGPSGYNPRGESIDSQTSTRSSEGDAYRDEGKEGLTGKKVRGQGSSKRKSRSHGGKKHKQKSSNKTEEEGK